MVKATIKQIAARFARCLTAIQYTIHSQSSNEGYHSATVYFAIVLVEAHKLRCQLCVCICTNSMQL
jgi:hypothetical protein